MEYIVTSEYLPVMDVNAMQVSRVIQNGTDAFCQVEFAGGKPCRTKIRTLKAVRAAMNPIFNYQIWYPVSVMSYHARMKLIA
jgi:hypothetical protein